MIAFRATLTGREASKQPTNTPQLSCDGFSCSRTLLASYAVGVDGASSWRALVVAVAVAEMMSKWNLSPMVGKGCDGGAMYTKLRSASSGEAARGRLCRPCCL